MPLVQLSLMIPLLAQFFLKEPENDFNQVVTFPSNWTFFVTIVSVMASLVTLGVSFTENYFAKPGRTTHKTKLRWIIFFLSIICQVVPKIFAYLVFSFGFVGHISGSNAIVPSLLILPLFMSIARATFYHLWEKSKSCCWSMLFGLSSMYILNEDNLSGDQNDKQKIEGKKRNMHITYDIYSVIETGLLTSFGVHYLEDANFDKIYFLILMTQMQLFGKLFKGTYYLYLHPWSNLNPVYRKFKIVHTCLSFAFFVGFMAFTALYSNSNVVNISILCLYGVILPMTILFILLRKSKYCNSFPRLESSSSTTELNDAPKFTEICKSSLHEKQTSLVEVPGASFFIKALGRKL